MSQYKLTYFNLRARAETARMLFALADVEYEDNRIERSDWGPDKKENTPFGQLPLLEVDGVVLCQSHVIEAFLANRFGLAGKTDLEHAKAAMIVSCIDDYLKQALPMFLEKDEEKQKTLQEKWQNEHMPAGLKKITKLLERNGGTYFVGDNMTYADVAFYVYVCDLVKFLTKGIDIDWEKWPKLAALNDRVVNHPKIAAWIAKRPQTDM